MLTRHVRRAICLTEPFLSRTLKTGVSELRKGDWIEHNGQPFVIQGINSAHSGRGARQFLITLKDALNDTITTLKPTSRDCFEKLEISDVTLQYLYEADEQIHLMHPKTMEEITVPKRLMQSQLAKVLEAGAEVRVRMCGDRPVMIHGSRTYKCTVVQVLEMRESDGKKSTVVALQTGARISCNLALTPGEQILVNVEDLSYVSRA